MKRQSVCHLSGFALLLVVFLLAGVVRSQCQVKVTTYHYDNFRTGQNVNEGILKPSVVNPNTFGKLFSQAVNGQLYAEPLYLPNVLIPSKGLHNVVFVATEHDSVYAFDADNNQGSNSKPLWRVSFVNPGQGITTIPSTDTGTVMIYPEVGITSTPVIDPRNGTLYVVAATKEKGSYFQRLHALDVTSGTEKFGGPVVIQATVPGTGWGSLNGKIAFDPLRNNQRAALLLMNGVIYIAWASHGLENQLAYHGWVIGYNENTLAQVAAYAVTPNGKQGGIWESGCGLAADAQGNIYFMAGNGTFDADSGGSDYGESYVKLSTTTGLSVVDYFTPFDEATLSAQDRDLGSGGAVLLPFQAGTAHPSLALGAGKNGVIYLLDRTNMGHFNSSGNQQIVQSITSAFGGHALYSTPAYWQHQMYFWAAHDFLRIFGISNGLLTNNPIAISTIPLGSGATPVVSSFGSTNGIVWALQTDQVSTNGPAVLHALDANTAVELYNSSQAGSRDMAGPAVKFAVPTVANGKVYVGTANRVDVYGLF
ncbi:MAG: pyrrolo-quinoline quinone [Acidobacteriia bacterium]|nr:pyrrolo-quinoline quinone [Terriglobia bacterium]